MCGRYTIGTDATALEARFQAQVAASRVSPSYNAAPSQGLPTILNANPQAITVSTWGFLPAWADERPDVKPLINARAETVGTKPFFREAFRTTRCLVLADGFYEWKRTGRGKVPYRIALHTEEPFAFAGIWSTVHDAQGRSLTTFAILTTDANALVAEVHNRMPVILHPQDEANWLNPETPAEQAQALLMPFPADLLRVYEVSPKVNSPAPITRRISCNASRLPLRVGRHASRGKLLRLGACLLPLPRPRTGARGHGFISPVPRRSWTARASLAAPAPTPLQCAAGRS